MTHLALPRFWQHYRTLPEPVRKLADEKFQLPKADPRHPSLHFKKISGKQQLWSVRVGMNYRALASEKSTGFVWFWLRTHGEYDQLLK